MKRSTGAGGGEELSTAVGGGDDDGWLTDTMTIPMTANARAVRLIRAGNLDRGGAIAVNVGAVGRKIWNESPRRSASS
jgi:hypothetical protein